MSQFATFVSKVGLKLERQACSFLVALGRRNPKDVRMESQKCSVNMFSLVTQLIPRLANKRMITLTTITEITSQTADAHGVTHASQIPYEFAWKLYIEIAHRANANGKRQ